MLCHVWNTAAVRCVLFYNVVNTSGYTAELEVIWKDALEGYHICICLKNWGRARKICARICVATRTVVSASFWWHQQFLGAFAKLRKGSVSFVMSVRPFVRVEQLCPHWTDFHEICYFAMFRKSVEKIQFSFKSNKNNGYLTWRPIYIFYRISHISYTIKNVLEKIVEKIKKTHFVFNNIFIPIITPFTK